MSVIVVKQANELVPIAYLEKALEKNSSSFGMAMVLDGIVSVESGIGTIGVSDLDEYQSEHMNKHLVMFFGDLPEQILEEDVQPFTLLTNTKDHPKLVVFAEGDFQSTYETPGSSHTPEFFLAMEHLRPKMLAYYTAAGEDLGKVIAELKSPMTKREMMNTSVGRGTLTFVTGTEPPEILSFSKNDLHGSFDWGWTSNVYDYVEKAPGVEAPAPVVVPPKIGLASKIKKHDAPTPSVPVKPVSVVQQQAPVASVPQVSLKASTAIPDLPGELTADGLLIPPKELWGKSARSELSNWYRKNAHNGIVPHNFKQHPAVKPKVKAGETVKTFADLPKPVVADIPIAPVKQVADVKPVIQSKATTREAYKPPQAVEQGFVPIISPAHKDQLLSFLTSDSVLKAIGPGSQEIIDPTRIKELEDKYASFPDQLGLTGLDETYRWPAEIMHDLVKKFPHEATILLLNYRASLLLAKPAEQPALPAAAATPAKSSLASKIKRTA